MIEPNTMKEMQKLEEEEEEVLAATLQHQLCMIKESAEIKQPANREGRQRGRSG